MRFLKEHIIGNFNYFLILLFIFPIFVAISTGISNSRNYYNGYIYSILASNIHIENAYHQKEMELIRKNMQQNSKGFATSEKEKELEAEIENLQREKEVTLIDNSKKLEAYQAYVPSLPLSGIKKIFLKAAPAINFTSIISVIGTFFLWLQYRLSKANSRKDLFDRRYEIFLVINQTLTDWELRSKTNNQLIEQIGNDIETRAFFLFNKGTFEFIKQFKKAIVFGRDYGTVLLETLNNKTYIEEVKYAHQFLVNLVDGEKLMEKFPELKINRY